MILLCVGECHRISGVGLRLPRAAVALPDRSGLALCIAQPGLFAIPAYVDAHGRASLTLREESLNHLFSLLRFQQIS